MGIALRARPTTDRRTQPPRRAWMALSAAIPINEPRQASGYLRCALDSSYGPDGLSRLAMRRMALSAAIPIERLRPVSGCRGRRRCANRRRRAPRAGWQALGAHRVAAGALLQRRVALRPAHQRQVVAEETQPEFAALHRVCRRCARNPGTAPCPAQAGGVYVEQVIGEERGDARVVFPTRARWRSLPGPAVRRGRCSWGFS
jgi:hypothetical protein